MPTVMMVTTTGHWKTRSMPRCAVPGHLGLVEEGDAAAVAGHDVEQ